MSSPTPTRTLCVIVCGAGPAPHVGILVDHAHEAGWDVHLLTTPAGRPFLDEGELARRTGAPVRTHYTDPGGRAGAFAAVIVAPATFNTVNKLAVGVADNYALSVAAEALGRGTPTVLLPFVNAALASRRPFIERFGACGRRVRTSSLGRAGGSPIPPVRAGTGSLSSPGDGAWSWPGSWPHRDPRARQRDLAFHRDLALRFGVNEDIRG